MDFFYDLLAPVCKLIGEMLYWFSQIFGGQYVFALLIYALLFKLLFLPFAIKQQKNQIKMAHLTPKIELIKAKYKGRTDQATMQKQQEEILELQQKEGYNPLSGCLPLLLQMPIIMFLYGIITRPLSFICHLSADQLTTVKGLLDANKIALTNDPDTKIDFLNMVNEINISGYIEKYRDMFGDAELSEEVITSLNRLPEFELFGGDLSQLPWDAVSEGLANFSWIFFIPIAAAAIQWFSVWITRKMNANPATQTQPDNPQGKMTAKMMDLMMPAMTLFMAYSLPGLMGIYWIYQSAFGILQTFILSKVMPLPKFTEEDVKELKRQQKEAEKNARNMAKEAPKVRSLHYIDDDDYDTLPELEKDEKDKKKDSGNMDLPEI